MPVSLEPSKNPILQVYEFFSEPGLQRIDKADFLGFRNLKLKTITSAEAKKLIALLRQTPGAISHCRLILNKTRLVDFTPSSPTEWFDRESIEQFDDRWLCANCKTALLSLRDDLDTYGAGVEWAGDDLLADSLSILDSLADCETCGESLEIDLRLDKDVVVKEYLLEGLADSVSSLLWYEAESFSSSFESFANLMLVIEEKAAKPIVVFLYASESRHQGDFLKILPLAGSPADTSTREKELAEDLATFTSQILEDYKVLRARHAHEHRPDERLDLPPSLFLQRKDTLAQYPSHKLLTMGALRSVLMYAMTAWLADESRLSDGIGEFTLVSPTDLILEFSAGDVKRNGASIFNTTADWQAVTSFVVREIGLSAGSELIRGRWSQAVSNCGIEAFAKADFFRGLECVYKQFIESKEASAKAVSSAGQADVTDSTPLLDIIVSLDPESDAIRFVLNGPGYVYERAGEVRLGGDDPDLRVAELSKLARQHLDHVLEDDIVDPTLQVPSVPRLDSRGVQLWRKLIPNDLKRAYASFREQKDLTIFIVSDDPSFPWELVKPFETKGKISHVGFDDLWWAVQFSIARWLSGEPPPSKRIALDRVCCIAADGELPSAERERTYLRNLAQTIVFPETYDEVLSVLSSQDFDLVHFACHGEFYKADPNESVLVLPNKQEMVPGDFELPKIIERFEKNKPLVFLNSCHSGRTGSSLIGLAGWAEEFIRLRCGAFIGCGWEVEDELAGDFALSFYDSFKGGMTMGKAVHTARKEIREKNLANPTWLAYYLYGNPNCVVRTK